MKKALKQACYRGKFYSKRIFLFMLIISIRNHYYILQVQKRSLCNDNNMTVIRVYVAFILNTLL